MPAKRKAEVVQLFKDKDKPQWNDTPRRGLARERNWCYYMLAAMSGLTRWMFERGWLSEPVAKSLGRSITSARYSVDAAWYDKVEALEAREAKRARR